MKRTTFLILLTLIALTSSGCDRDERVEEMAKRSLERQPDSAETEAMLVLLCPCPSVDDPIFRVILVTIAGG